MADLNWCRDVDYGNLPQWIALIIGGVVAGFTIFGILTARKAYVEDVRTREYAQARLIYAEAKSDYWMSDGEEHVTVVKGMPDFVLVRHFEYDEYDLDDERVGEIRESNGRVIVRAKPGYLLRVVVVVIHNNSEELISLVNARFNFNYETDPRLAWVYFPVIAPRSKAYGVIVSDNRESARTALMLTFQDSTGNRWRRYEARPVTKTRDDEEFM